MARRTRGGGVLHVPTPPRRSRPWSQGNLAGGASADFAARLCTGYCVPDASGIPSVRGPWRTGRRQSAGSGKEKGHIYQALYTGPLTTIRHGTCSAASSGGLGSEQRWPRHHPWPWPRAVIYPSNRQVIRTHIPRFGRTSQHASVVFMRRGRAACGRVATCPTRGQDPRRSEGRLRPGYGLPHGI